MVCVQAAVWGVLMARTNQVLAATTQIESAQVRFVVLVGLCKHIYYIYVHKVDAQGISIQWRAWLYRPGQAWPRAEPEASDTKTGLEP